MPIPAYRAKQSTNTTGTGTIVLNAAETNARSFNAAYGAASRRILYMIAWQTGYEFGLGDFDGGTPGNLTRATVLASSNAGALVTLPAGTKDVFAVFDPAAREVVSISATATLALADLGNAVVFTGSSAATLNLPAVATAPNGAGWLVMNGGTAALTIDPSGAETVNNAATLVLQAGASALLARNGAVWSAAVMIGPNVTGDFPISGVLSVSGAIRMQAGSAALPAITPVGDTNTGIFSPGADQLAVSVGGNNTFEIRSSTTILQNAPGVSNSANLIGFVDASATVARAGEFGFLNENGISLASFYANVATDGSGNLELYATPAGARTSGRRVLRMSIPGSGPIQANNSLDVSGNLRFDSGYGSVAQAYGCRAWVNFNGTGTVAIRASGNVSSITDNGTGDYTVNFTTNMPDANYCVVGVGASNGPDLLPLGPKGDVAPATSSVRVWVKSVGVAAGAFDPLYANVSIFR
ncbi:MAG: hypothetical protein ACK5X3_06525 [Pseudomonadota bacterium]